MSFYSNTILGKLPNTTFFLILSDCEFIIFITMKKNPHSPHIMLSHCRVCKSTTSFFVKAGINQDLSQEQVQIYEEITRDEYLELKKMRLKATLATLTSKLKKYKNCKSSAEVIKYIKLFDYDSLFFDSNRIKFCYDDTFPLKTLKSVFSSLRIVLIAKSKGGKDE